MKTYYITPSGGVLCLRSNADRSSFLRAKRNGYRKVPREVYVQRLAMLIWGWKGEWI